MKSILKVSFLLFVLMVAGHTAYSQTAALLPNASQVFLDNNGKPLSSGTVSFYIPGTMTPKMVWQDANQTTPWTQPITLNAGGRPPGDKGIYGNGTYRQIVKSSALTTIWDQPTAAVGAGSGSGTSVGDGNSVGTILAWSGMTAPNQYQFAYGQSLVRATYPELLQAVTLLTDIVCTGGSQTVTGIADTSNIPVGAALEANCIPAGSVVTAKTLSTVTVSIAANISTNSSGRFFPYGNGNGTTTFNAPDLRGRVMPGRNNMGGVVSANLTSAFYGSIPDAIGATGGSQSRALAQANLPNVNFNVSIPSGQGAHTHSYTLTTAVNQTLQPGGANIATVSTSTTNTGSSTLPAMTGTAASGGTATAFAIVPPSLTMNYIIKVTPDTSVSGLFGVASIGGMQGVILCGTGITCAGNTISSVVPVPSVTALDVTYTATGTGGTSQTLYSIISKDCLTPEMFGAVGNGIADDTTALNNWYAQVLAQNTRGCLNGSNYRASANLTWNIPNLNGVNIVGLGMNQSLLTFDPGFGLEISSSLSDAFYSSFKNLRVNCNFDTGPCIRLGKHSFADNLNEFILYNVYGSNGSAAAGAIGLEINSVLNSDFFIGGNTGGAAVAGTAMKFRQMRFSRVMATLGNTLVGMYFTDGFNYGNVFTNHDIEVVGTAIKIDNAQSLQNTFIGGTIAIANVGYDFTAGSSNIIMNPNEAAITTLVANGVGLVMTPTTSLTTGQIYSGVTNNRPTATSTPVFGIAGSTLGTIGLSGNTSGVVTIQPQAAAGTYNFNLPTSAGTLGGPLLSGGGGVTPQSYGTRSGNTTVFGTTSGALTSGNCAKFDANGNIVDNGSACASGGTPGGANTQVQFNNSGAFAGSANMTWVSPKLTLGAAGTTGQFGIAGTTSGNVTQTVQAIAGTPTITWGNSTGTPAVTATSPLAITTSTGNITCTTCGVTGSPLSQFANTTSAQLSGMITDETGSGALVFGTAPTITLANGTGLPISTGVSGLGTGVATFLATPSSANLATAVTDETGTGALVFATTPVFSTNITAPLVIGGSGTTGTQLTLKTTTGVGTTDALAITGGNNGATTFGVFNSTGFGIGASPTTTLYVTNPSGSGTVTQRMHSGAGDADYAFDGTSIFYTNYTSGGAISFSQVGAGSQSFVVNGAAVLSLTSANAAVTGNLVSSGSIGCGAPTTKTGTSGTIGNNECSVIFNPSGTYTATLPTASSYPGRFLYVKSIAAQTINSASSNVVPRTTAAAGTALLASGAGNWATLQSDGTNWVVMSGN